MEDTSKDIHHTLKALVATFPLSSGVYLMKDVALQIIYVGKAKELRKRVQSYLRTQNSGKVEVLMSHVRQIDYIVTENEYDALLLEHNLIKEHYPKYNILLRDDKTFPMIKITKEEYPRVLKTRRLNPEDGEYFGPYIDVFLMNKYLELIEKNFSLRRCTKMRERAHPCMYYHIGRCPAVCANLTTKEDYLVRVRKIKSLLNGHTKTLKKDITVQMHRHAKALEYEQAAQCRDSFSALQSIETRQHMIDQHTEFRNYIGIANYNNSCCIVIVHMKEGRVIDQHTTHLNTFDSIVDSLEQFLLGYYTEQALYPEYVFTPLSCSPEIRQFFSAQDTIVQTPQQVGDRAIMRFAKENAKIGLNQHMREHGNIVAVQTLQNTLELDTAPLRIEGFDIAHVGGTHTTASMVSFYNGMPDKAQYRRFTIKSLQSGEVDDFQSIQEAVSRRYTRLKNEKLSMPNLIVIDGGLGQVNSAKQVLDALSLDIPIIGLAKKFEEIYFPGALSKAKHDTNTKENPLRLALDDPSSKLLQAIRDEAHRFATSTREKKQIKSLDLSVYTQIKGVGKKTAQKILTLYPNSSAILSSNVALLTQTLGVSEAIAEALIALCKEINNK